MGEGRILIIDDDEHTRSAYKDLFSSYGFVTEATESDRHAYELLQRDNYQAVLLDLRVSNEALFSVAEKIKAAFPKIFVSMMVVDLTPAMMKRATDVEIDECMVKPLLPVKLIATIRKGILRYRLEEENRYLMEKLKLIEGQNQHWIRHDLQTGVYNSKYLNERLDVEIKRAKRHEHRLSVLLCDLIQSASESKKQEVGISSGDEYKKLVKVISDSVRDIDIVARYKKGFAVILPETNSEGSSTLCGRLKENFSDAFEFNENIPDLPSEQKPAVRLGIATYPFDANLPDGLLDIAEERLQ